MDDQATEFKTATSISSRPLRQRLLIRRRWSLSLVDDKAGRIGGLRPDGFERRTNGVLSNYW